MFIFHDLFDDLFFEYELSIIFWNCPTFIFFDPWLNYDHDDLKFHHNRAKYYTCIYIFLHFLHFWCWHSFTQQNLRHPSTWVNYRRKTFSFFHGSVTAETDVERCHPQRWHGEVVSVSPTVVRKKWTQMNICGWFRTLITFKTF